MPKKTTMADIARLAGVSSTAVSFALNGREGISEETRARILAIASDVGWLPNAAARALTRRRVSVVGLVLTRPPRQVSLNTFYMRFIAGLEAELSTIGSSLLLHIAADDEDEAATYRRWVAEARVDGVALLDLRVNDQRLALLKSLELPTVVVGDPRYAAGHVAVWTDDDRAVGDAVRRLHELGHRRFARVGERREMAHTSIRTAAFLRACGDLDLPTPQIVEAEPSAPEARRATQELLQHQFRPTAVLYDSDVMAVAGLNVAAAMAIDVPADLSILAYDDSMLCEITAPSLSAINHDIYAYGSHTARCLQKVIEGGASETAVLDSTPSLIERQSTGPCR